MNSPYYEIICLDVSKKWLDDTKTTVELIFHSEFGVNCVLGYVHTDESVSECKEKKEFYLDMILEEIRKSCLRGD